MMRRPRKLSMARNYAAFTSLLFQCCIAACSSPRILGFKSAPIVSNMFHVRHLGARRYSITAARRWRHPKRSHRPVRHQYFAPCMNHEGTSSSRQDFLEATSIKVLSTSFAIAMTESFRQAPVADAFCGKPYPRWAYFVNFDEVLVPFTFGGYSGELFVRTVGNEKDQTKVCGAKAVEYLSRFTFRGSMCRDVLHLYTTHVCGPSELHLILMILVVR